MSEVSPTSKCRQINWFGVVAGLLLILPALVLFHFNLNETNEILTMQLTWYLLFGVAFTGIGSVLSLFAHQRRPCLEGIGKCFEVIGWCISFDTVFIFAVRDAGFDAATTGKVFGLILVIMCAVGALLIFISVRGFPRHSTETA